MTSVEAVGFAAGAFTVGFAGAGAALTAGLTGEAGGGSGMVAAGGEASVADGTLAGA